MSLEGLKLACLYSFGCPKMLLHAKKLPPDIDSIFENFLQSSQNYHPQGIEKVLKLLEPFEHYQIIARSSGIADVFDEKVVRAYWFGKNPEGEMRRLENTHNFTVLKKIRAEIINNPQLPQQAVNLLFDCLVCPAKIAEISRGKMEVFLESVEYKKRFVFGEEEFFFASKKAIVEKSFAPEIEEEDWISVHLGIVRERICREEVALLQNNILEAIEFFCPLTIS